MKLLINDHWRHFTDQVKKKDVTIIYIATPFLTTKGANQIIKYFNFRKDRKNKFEIKLIVNCSKLNLLTSLEDIKAPIELLIKKYDRLEVRNNVNLHAKLYLTERVAMFGSSNLTNGGMTTNKELNTLICSNTKVDKNIREELKDWYLDIWKHSVVMDEKYLKQMDTYEDEINSVRNVIKGLLGGRAYHLAGDQCKKLKKIFSKEKWKKEQLADLLSEVSDDEKEKDLPKNTESKIIYLEHLGFLHRKYVGTKQVKEVFEPVLEYKDLVKDKAKLYKYMCDTTPLISQIHCYIARKPGCKIKDLAEATKLDQNSDELLGARHWLYSLNYIKEGRQGREKIFTSKISPTVKCY